MNGRQEHVLWHLSQQTLREFQHSGMKVTLTNYITKSTNTIQGISSILWNPKVHYRVHKSPNLVPHPEPDGSTSHPHYSYLTPILILSPNLRLGVLVVSFFRFSCGNPLCILLSHAQRATCPTQLILLDFIIRMKCGEECTLRSSSLCNIFRPPIASLLLSK
jgi:hypothetical protein